MEDLELKPPLAAITAEASSPKRNALKHSLLCRMFVAAKVLKLSNETRFSSLVLLHRYFDAQKEDSSVNWKWIAAACLFLGTKGEEEIRRLRDILNVADMLEFGAQDSSSTLETINVKNKPMLLDEDYWKAKEQLVVTEQHVLRILQFDVCVSHPHRAVAVLLSSLSTEGDKQELLSTSWKFLNQALFSAPALRFNILTLACAAIECAQTRLDITIHDDHGIPWWYKYGVSYNSLQPCKTELEKAASL